MFNRSIRAAMMGATSVAALGMSLAAVSTPALAQDEPLLTDRVVVTGSRIARRDFQANSPIVTVDEAAFENRSSFAVEATLNQLPQFQPGGSESLGSSAGNPFADADAAPGAATLNLRGLGANRSLILVNGRRPQPVNSQLVVDVNTIPAAAIQNVEVITGGAAAVYGADAIAGVVNFILRRDFEGFEVDAQYGLTEQGDNRTAQVNVLVGGNFADGRGNAMLGASWSQRGRAFARDREFTRKGWNDPSTTAGSIDNTGITQVNLNNTQYGVNPDGTLFLRLRPQNPSPGFAPYRGPLHEGPGGSGFKINPDGSLGYNDPNAELSVPLTRYSLFGSATYELTSNVRFFVEGNFTETETTAISLVPPAFNIWGLSMPYNPANDDPDSPTFGANPANWHPVSGPLADLLNARPNPAAPWTLNRGLDFMGRLHTDTTSNIYQLTAGFEGELPFKDWTWEIYGSHGKTNVLSRSPDGTISQENIQQIFDGRATALLPGGVPRITSTGPWSAGWNNGEAIAVVGSCTSGIPLFNPDGSVPAQVTVSQDCIDYATLRLNNATLLEQNIVEATMQGGLFDIWAGEVRFALGAAYRSEDFSFNPDSGYSAQQARANAINLIALPQYTEGYFDVGEVYGEVLIPLISDLPFIQQLDLELGGRHSDYSTAGGIQTYKILGDWEVNDWLRFRGGYQVANRAPNIYELFAPVAGSLVFGANDPCTNIQNFTASYGNLPSNPNRVNLQLACAELIARDGGFRYDTLAQRTPAGGPGVDDTHISNFNYTVVGRGAGFPISIALQQGNPDLDSEKAKTWTLGGVITSPVAHPLLDRFNLSVDWYSIDLKGTISVPSYGTVYSQCLDPQFNPLIASAPGSVSGAEILAGSQYCDLINREPVNAAGAIGAVGSGLDRNYDGQFVNQGGTKTSGIDVAVNWGADFEDMGAGFIPGGFNWNVVANFLLDFSESPFPGAPFVDYTGTLVNSSYDYRVFSTFTWMMDSWSVGLRTRYLPEIDAAPTATPGSSGAASHTEWDLFGRYLISDTYELRAGVDNLLDELPETVGSTPTNTNTGSTGANYDQFGRRFYIGATARF
jgi:outer membrane receptor protein involved in Fe transport